MLNPDLETGNYYDFNSNKARSNVIVPGNYANHPQKHNK